MSLISKSQAACCKCGNSHELPIYKSINTSEDTALKQKVMDGSLFVWECPDCGQMNLVKYESLYHDPEKKIMVWLLPTGELPNTEMTAILNHTKAMGDYTLRRVSDVTSLMEKVLLFEEGLDDMAIEMCKYVTKMEMAAKKEDQDVSSMMNLPMHFLKKEDEVITLSFPQDGKMAGCRIGYNVYEDCLGILERNRESLKTEGFAKIDSEWILSMMK